MTSMDKVVWIKGAGDIGSAAAHRLHGAGLRPVLLELARPLVTRRLMAFATAMHDGEAEVEGLRGARCGDGAAAEALLAEGSSLPVVAWDEVTTPVLPAPAVVVDARMRKKQVPPVQMAEAPLVLGIGPGFRAGEQVHGVVESNWGEHMGHVTWEGGAMAYTGQVREVEGHTDDRYVRASAAGTFHTGLRMLERVTAGQVVGRLGAAVLTAPISGILRGLAHDGMEVRPGVKLVEVDPRGDARFAVGIAERPGRIGDGVLAAVRARLPKLFE